MTFSYLKLALRLLSRNPLSTFINVLPVLILLIIMLASVASTLLNVNKVSPVDSLRQE